MAIATNGEELKEGMPVLVRDRNKECWRYNIFSYYAEGEYYPYVCIDRAYNKCIPYDTNKKLVNCSENYEFSDYKPEFNFKFGAKVKAKNKYITVIGFLADYNPNDDLYNVIFHDKYSRYYSSSGWFPEIEYIED